MQNDGERRSGFLHRLAVLLPGVASGSDDVSVVANNVDVPRLAQRDDGIGDVVLLGVGVKGLRPRRTSARAAPLIRWKFVDHEHLIGTGRDRQLDVALVEAIDQLMHGRHHVRLIRCCCHRGCQHRDAQHEEKLALEVLPESKLDDSSRSSRAQEERRQCSPPATSKTRRENRIR
jgi:hypothetical protein